MNDRTGSSLGRGDEDLDDPAVAFGKLTATISRLSEDVQMLIRTIMADRVQRQEELQEIGRRIQAIQAADPREDLGQVGRELGVLSKHVETLSRQPLLAKGPEHLETVITRAGVRVAKDTGASHQTVMADIEFVARDLKEQAKGIRTRKRQRWWVGSASAAGLALGFLLYPVAAMTQPGGSYLAAAATGHYDRWDAGLQLVEDHDAWSRAVVGFMMEIFHKNEAVLMSCSNALRQSGQSQACRVEIQSPLPRSKPMALQNVQ